jgi:hypothetical protein
MRAVLAAAAIALAAVAAGCGRAPAPSDSAAKDITREPWYGETTEQLASLVRQAGEHFQRGEFDAASALIQQGQPLSERLLSATHPTLPAMKAVSGLDDLYARMLLRNRHYGWARLLFQKNLARWKNWSPQTEESARLLERARSGIAECDRHMTE